MSPSAPTPPGHATGVREIGTRDSEARFTARYPRGNDVFAVAEHGEF